jgi:hypothetical protein
MNTEQNQKLIYKGVVITKLPDGKWMWYDNHTTLAQCKKEIDKEFGGRSPLRMFEIKVK